MVKHIPNSITLLNLFFGCCGILACFNHQYALVPIFIGISLLADFLDGFIARALNVKSDLGGQLDSLADMVTFGVLPGMMLYSVLSTDINLMSNEIQINRAVLQKPAALLGFVYTLFACLRLAKFNLDTRQTVNFIGLNTPACSLFVLGFYMQYFTEWRFQSNWDFIIYSNIAAMIIPFILAFFAVAEIEIFSMKGNPFSWKENKMRVLFLLSTIPQLFFLKWIGLSTIIISYVIFALLHTLFKQQKVQ